MKLDILGDLLFPNFCAECKEKTALRFLCEKCWTQSALADPSNRCPYCFLEVDAPGICISCKKRKIPIEQAFLFEKDAPILSVIYREESVEAAAGFFQYQLMTLGWQKPDLIASIPMNKHPIGTCLADLLQVPYRPIFRKKIWPLGFERLELKELEIEGVEKILVLDFRATKHQTRLAIRSISTAFFEKIYFLSISE